MMTDTNSINWPQEKVEKLVGHYKEILSLLGEDPERASSRMLTGNTMQAVKMPMLIQSSPKHQ